ncbi:MAG TPA: hypothetical protein VFY68_15835 [Nitrososphaeraceae archaeon]|nr:hypothetical protein [Nitrososphaeraceae archaeon]
MVRGIWTRDSNLFRKNGWHLTFLGRSAANAGKVQQLHKLEQQQINKSETPKYCRQDYKKTTKQSS